MGTLFLLEVVMIRTLVTVSFGVMSKNEKIQFFVSQICIV